MKKQIFYAALAAAAVLTACNKTPEPAPASEGNKVTIRAVLPQTKVAASAAETGLSWSWEAGDKLTVIGSTTEVFDIKSGFTAREAEFDGTAVSSGPYTILYPGTLTSMTDAEKYDWTKQKQVGNDSPAHLQYLAALEGVDQYEEFSFDAEWAAAHGGTLKQSGVVKFVLTLPEAITGVKKVEAVIPAVSVSVGLELEDVTLAEGNVLTAYAGFPWTDLTVPVALETTVMVTTDKDVVWNKTITLPAGASIQSGKVNNVVLNVNGWECTGRYAGGTGVEGDPWLIDNALHMVHMNEDLTNGSTLYFKLINDIDMTDIAWNPANAVAVDSKFDKGINFDGNNHTISNLDCASDAYPSLFGVLYGTVKNLTIDGANIHGSGKAGVLAGYLGTGNYSATVTGVTITNSEVVGNNFTGGLCGQIAGAGSVVENNHVKGTKVKGTVAGGFAGEITTALTLKNCSVEDGEVTASARYCGGMIGAYTSQAIKTQNCYVKNTSVTSTADRVGGFIGELPATATLENCYTEGVTVKGTINVGGLAGVCYGAVTECTSNGSVSSSNTTSNADIAIGGLAGYVDNDAAVFTKCSSSVVINQTTNGRDIGGFIGKLMRGTVRQCYSTGSVKGIQRNVGGFIGLISVGSSKAIVENCYSTGKVEANSYNGGFIGLYEKGNATITNCYSTSEAVGQFAVGGMVGVVGAAAFNMSKSVAWNSSVTGTNHGETNWSSAAVVGVTFPTCTLTDNYRNPDMTLTAYWVPAANYQHANVSSAHPLVKQDGTETTATSTANGQDGYPQFPYHGKVEAGKTLSQIASATLGWDASVWDFSGALPVLK